MGGQSAEADWSFFDRIYCISLKNRDDRRLKASQAFARVGLAERLAFVLVDRHPTDCEQGIYESHMICLRKGLSAGADAILIFEDDVEFDRFSPERLRACTEYLKGLDHWKILFLGAIIRASRPTTTRAVRQVHYRALSHAYAVSRSYARQLLEKPWQKKPYDGILAHFDPDEDGSGVYACAPMIAFQSDAATDNVNRSGLDRLRRLFGGLRRIQKANEWYHCHKLLFWALHGVALGIVAVAVLWFVF